MLCSFFTDTILNKSKILKGKTDLRQELGKPILKEDLKQIPTVRVHKVRLLKPTFFFKKTNQTRPLFLYFHSFHMTNIAQIL